MLKHLPINKIAAGVTLSVLTAAAMTASTSAATTMPISFHAWKNGGFSQGSLSDLHIGNSQGKPALALNNGSDSGTWTSNTFTLPAPVDRIVTSWQADAPGDSWTETKLQVQLTDGSWSHWYTTGTWAFNSTANADGSFTSRRASPPSQDDAAGYIDQDTFWANTTKVKAYRVQEVLHAENGQAPKVRQVAAIAADTSQDIDEQGQVSPVSNTTMKRTIDLNLPSYSEYAHNGQYTQLDGGGAAWCSPASVAMVLGYYHTGPTAAQIQSLPADAVFDASNRKDGAVNYAAYHIFDNGVDMNKNTGDWPFNTAYAASFGMNSSVRQYNSLQDLEQWIKKGVPVTVSIQWDNTSSDVTQHLDGSSIAKTPGHLMVVGGFTKDGDVIAYDPASPAGDQQVRHTYNRAQFEHLWLRSKEGTVYIIKPQAR